MNAHLPSHPNQPTPRALFIAALIKRLRVCYECFCYIGRGLGSQLGVYSVKALRLLRVIVYRMARRGTLSFASAPAIRSALHHSTQLSRYFAHIVGLVVIAGVMLCWLSPALRQAFMMRLAPVFEVAPSAPPAPVFAAAHYDAAGDVPGGLEPLARPRFASFEARVRKISSARVAADARDDQILASPQERLLVVDYLARRYRVARAPLNKLVKQAFTTGQEFGLDPLLLLSVIAIESRFNPYAESGVGAQGLMQVMSRLHADKFDHFGGGVAAAFDPLANLKVGALILKDCIVRGGSLAQGLRLYVGAISKYDGVYGAKVQAERGRLREVAQGRDVSIHLPQKPSRAVIQAYNKTPRGTVLSQPKKRLVATTYAVPKNAKKKVVAIATPQTPKIVIIPTAKESSELGV